jgi:hypothetical protein
MVYGAGADGRFQCHFFNSAFEVIGCSRFDITVGAECIIFQSLGMLLSIKYIYNLLKKLRVYFTPSRLVRTRWR